MNVVPALRCSVLPLLLLSSPCLLSQDAASQASIITVADASLSLPASFGQDQVPVQATAPQLQNHPAGALPPSSAMIASNGRPYAMVDGAIYQRPSAHDFFKDYVRDTYGLPAIAATSIRAVYAQARDKPTQWTQDWSGFGDRFGASAGQTVISGNVRYGMEMAFKEDLRYYPCHHCSVKGKIENALLAEITARHDVDGHRFFTLTPTVADFSGPIIAHTLWYPGPNQGPFAGVVSARTYFATRIGAHLFREFILDRRHKAPNVETQPH